MPTYLITGANRGIGLEFVRQLSEPKEKKNVVLACVRNSSSTASGSLKNIIEASAGTVHLVEVDTGSLSSISKLADSVSSAIGKDGKIDYLLNNAGINATPEETSLSISRDSLIEHMDVNVLGPAKVVETLQGFLKKGSVVMNMTSGLGSCGKTVNDIKESKCATYSISKAAVDMLTIHQSFALNGQGVRVVCVDPGWVKTRMGGEGAVLEPEESVGGILKTIHGLGENDTAKIYDYSGQEIPW